MSFESVKALLDNRDYGSLIGLQENAWLEVKGSTPYDLDTPKGRYELAKDVAAFANGTGGIIIVGLRTTRPANAHTEVVAEYDLCAEQGFDVRRYMSLIEEYTHPAVEGLNVRWVPVSREGTHGLGVIEVPPQNPDRQYFLIANVVDTGAKIRQFVFGIVRRNESSNDPFTIAELYRYTQTGKSSIAQALTRIEEKFDTLLGHSRTVERPNPEAAYAARAARILNDEDA